MGFLPTPAGRPFMRRLGMSCPARRRFARSGRRAADAGARGLRGASPAPRARAGPAAGRRAPGGREALDAARGATCTARERPSALLTCREASAAGSHDEATFGFAPDGRLVSVSRLRSGLAGPAAAGFVRGPAKGAVAQLGEGAQAGDATAAALAGAPLRTARLQYRFSDYLATVTAMNLPAGIALREQYQSAWD